MKKILDLLSKTKYILTPAQKKLCVIVFILTCIGSLLECIGVSAIIPLVNVIQDPSGVMNSSLVQKYELLRSLSYEQMVITIITGVILLYVLKNAFFILLSWVRVKFSTKIQRETSIRMMSSLMSRGYEYFLNTNCGQYYQSSSGDPAAINVVITSLFRLISESMTIALISILLFVSDWQMALAVVALAFICLLLVFFVFRKRMAVAGRIVREYSVKMGQAQAESYYGIKDILLARKQSYFIYKYEKNSIINQRAECKREVGAESPGFIIEAICISGLMLCVCIRILLFGSSSEFIGILAAFAVGAFRILPSLGRISASVNALIAVVPKVTSLYNGIIAAEEYVKDHPEAGIRLESIQRTHGLISKGFLQNEFDGPKEEISGIKFNDKVELRDVTFSYDEKLGEVLKNVSLSIKKGEAIGIVGESGAGKSTLVDVLLGLLVPQSGGIYMDDQKITDDPDKWAQTIAYVPQTVFMCDDTIRRNVAFGERDEDIDEDRVKEALEKAKMLDFVMELPDGLDSNAGDRGTRISGGQRQRIAIARALYRRPEILVLDEATSALDNDTEAAIMDAINELYGQITLIIVAHRLTTIEKCDSVYEVKEGKIYLKR